MRKVVFASILLLASEAHADYVMEDLLSLSLADLATIPVVTAARTQQNWDDVQGSLWVITEKEIRERGYRNIADVLRDLPSVDLQGPFNTTSRLTVRGHRRECPNVDLARWRACRCNRWRSDSRQY